MSTRFLLTMLAVISMTVCAYVLFSSLRGGGVAWHERGEKSPTLTSEEKAEVVRSLSQSTTDNADTAPPAEQARLRVLQNVAQSSYDFSTPSDADKLKALRSLHSK